MELTTDVLGGLLLAAILIGVTAIVLSVVALSGQRRVRGAYRAFSQGSREDVLTLLQRHIDRVEDLRGEVATLQSHSYELRDLLRSALSRVGTVRYDAFDELGGQQSFSSALLDERGDGVVITAISGRTDTRAYAKAVTGGRSRHNLSEEEAEAVNRAMSMAGRTTDSDEPDLVVRARSRPRARPRSRRPAPSR